MTVSSRLHVPGEDSTHVPSLPLAITSLPSEPLPFAVMAILLLAAVISIHHSTIRGKDNTHRFPLANPKRPWEFSPKRAQMEFQMNSTTMIDEAVKKYAGQPFRLWTLEYGQVLVLPERYVNEIKNDARFNFCKLIAKRFHTHLPGFRDGVILGQDNRIIQNIVRNNLTQSISQLSGPISNECALVLEERLPQDGEWHEVSVQASLIGVVARLSTVVFSGLDLARDSEWIELSTHYTEAFMSAVLKLYRYPWYLRRLANVFVAECRALRASQRRAQAIVEAKLAERQREREKGDQTEYNDVLEWFEKEYQRVGGLHDPTMAQLILSVAAIHTTTDLLSEVVLDLARHGELVGPLRQEIQEALGVGGFSKASLQKMKLLDSVIKETQRMRPAMHLHLERRVMEDVTLSDNLRIRRDSTTVVVSPLRNGDIYERPDEYDGYRFYRLRQQPGKQNTSQLVTASPDNMAFGLGATACPGRFFVAHELKIILCHLLLKYDWALPDGGETGQRIMYGNTPNVNPMAKIAIRRRDDDEVEGCKLVV